MESNRENKQILLQRNNVWHPCDRMTVRIHTCVCAKSLSHVWLFVTLWTIACQVPLSMGFSRQEYWSGLPCPPPGDLPHPGIEPASLHLHGRRVLYRWATREAWWRYINIYKEEPCKETHTHIKKECVTPKAKQWSPASVNGHCSFCPTHRSMEF